MKLRQHFRLTALALILIAAATSLHAEKYITDVITIGAEKGKGSGVITEYRNKGWIVDGYDLNLGAGGWDIYVAYKTSDTANPETGYITDICTSEGKTDAFVFEGRTYYRAATNSGFNGDLNCDAGGAYIFLYYTRERGNLGTYGADKRVITKLSVSNQMDDGDQHTAAISWRNCNKSGICDLNNDAGGEYIYIHQHFAEQTLKFNEEPVFAQDLTFDGKYQDLIAKDPYKSNYGSLRYRVNSSSDGAWSNRAPMASAVGNYKVEARLFGVTSHDINFANNSPIVSKTVTIHPPIVKASRVAGVFNQSDKTVKLSWDVGAIPGKYSDFWWVVCRDGTKIAQLPSSVHTYSDTGFTNETSTVYDVYYVSKFWDADSLRDDTKATTTVNTTRSVPVKGLSVDPQDDRVVFEWTTDAFPEGFGNKFRIYVNDDDKPAITLEAAAMQSRFRWEHRTTDQHTNRQNKVDAETGVHYTEEPLNACGPNVYRIVGCIGDTELNSYSVSPKAIAQATKFYSLDASKGVYEGSVKLSWNVDQQGSELTKTYIVERRRAEQESDQWETLTRLASTDDYLFYTDETAVPGVYYDYRVTVEDKCSDGTTISSETVCTGFAKGTGTVTGRIAFGSSGTAVQGVDVVMTMTSTAEGNGRAQFHSMYFSGSTGSVMWAYPSEDYASTRFSDGDFSLQLWLYPEAFGDATIADFGGGAGLAMTSGGRLAFNDGLTRLTFDSLTLQKDAYSHIALTRKGKTLTAYVLTPQADSSRPAVQKASLTLTSALSLPGATPGRQPAFELGHFKGAADEFRLWTRCLSEADIVESYDHLLVGNEPQLETYWTFDEGLHTQFFDYSRDGSNYRKHHGSVGSNAQTSVLTPPALKLRARTDADGNYIIQGIPFTGEGTSYSVVPLYGIHEFNPNRTLLFVGSNALVHTADFEDVSSFPMEGYIYYAGTNVPAEGIMLYVDGMPVSKNGQAVMTNSNGYYQISVPIGSHYVEAKLESHTMVDGGRFPTQGTLYFDRAMTHNFTDSTLVSFVGRVGGGERNDTLAVGFAESNNNIGIATLRLGLNNEAFSLNCESDYITDAKQKRYYESDTTSIRSTAWTGTGFDTKYIYVRTDSLTGEFSAKLPPLQYVVKSLTVDNNPDIEFGVQSDVDLTKPGITFTDSLKHWDDAVGDSIIATFSYNTKKVYTYYAAPEAVVKEKGNEEGAFGINEKAYTDDEGEKYVIGNLWTKGADGSVSYLLDYPVYDMGQRVEYDIYAFERYVNRDGQESVTDIVPLPAQEITIVNEMSDEQAVIYRVDDPSLPYKAGEIYELKSNTALMGADGHLTYRWGVGLPNIVEPHTRHFAITMSRQGRTYSLVDMDAVVLGQLTNGSNFVTKGPDNVDFVLRDPQGAKSTTKLKKGNSTTKTTFDTRRAYGNYSLMNNVLCGVDFESGAGFGFILITGQKVQDEIDAGVNTSWEKVWNYDEVWVEASTENVSTSGNFPYVGAPGDVYVGSSVNFLIGGCRQLFIARNPETGRYELKMEEALAIGDSITTAFKYTQYELETVMIPKWKDMRRNFLTEVATEAEAKAYVNNGEQPRYLTWKGKYLDDYSEGTDYRWAKPASWETTPPPSGAAIDSVAWCNNQITAWETVIKENEEDKVKLMTTTTAENISIDGGSSYSYSKRTSHSKNDQVTRNWKMGVVVGNKFGLRTKAVASAGWIIGINTENGGGFTKGDGTKTESYTEWEYSIADNNFDTDLSINIYKSENPKYSDFFSVFGGQTYNPYQPQEVTHYYKPGTPLGNATLQMEQPRLAISVGNQNPSKNVTVTDIPAGGEANVTLHCTNMATANQGLNFSYEVLVIEKTNDKGLQILMDGVPVSGRYIMLNHNETTTKTLTIRQTDQSILDYEGIVLRFRSQYQPASIYDDVTLNAHFVPSSSKVDLVISEPVLNTETLTRNEGDLELKVANFDRQFKGMTTVGVEYRYEGSTTWTRPDTLTFLVNRNDSTKPHQHVLPATGDLRLRFNMSDDNFYPQGTYTFRAYTTTMYGSQPIDVYSSEVTVVKDNMRPRNLTTPAPTNGILRYGDDIVVEFNEDIVPGYVTDKNVIVTAKLNNQPVRHEVAKQLLPYGSEERTVNPIFPNGDFSIDCWLMWQDGGSILRFGEGLMELSIDDEGHFAVSTYGHKVKSQEALPKDKWIYLVVSFRADDKMFTALAQYDDVNVQLLTNVKTGREGTDELEVDYSNDNYLYLGNMLGAIHDLSLFSIYRDVAEAAATRYQEKNNYVYGLANYWPMNEGHGHTAADSRHTHDFQVNDSWLIDNVNYALQLRDAGGAKADISRINTGMGDSYAIELWTRANSGGKDSLALTTVFEAGSNENNRLGLYINKQKDWILRHGQSQTVVMSGSDFLSSSFWSHIALNVVRGQAASFYFNGRRTAVIAETAVPPLQGATLTLGKDMSDFSAIDELRIWHAAISEDQLLAGQYNCVDTTENYSRGLVAYYPFEKAGTVNGVETKVETLENMAPQTANTAKRQQLTTMGDYALVKSTPPLKNAPVESRLIAKPVASERKIVVRLEEGAGISVRDVEGAMLNITVDKIFDKHGNQSLPIRWQAYCQLNTLKWEKDTVLVVKRYGDEATFDVAIGSWGGHTEYYTISNMPQWLSVDGDSDTGELPPLTIKKLRFRVSPHVAVGNYDVTIGLKGNNDILEPLRIVVRVRAEMPDWTVNPADYENNMAVVGQVYIDGMLLGDSECRLAAFIDGVCRGVAAPKMLRGAAYVPLSIYGTAMQEVNGKPASLDKGRIITFRLWDAVKGIVHPNVSVTLPDGTVTQTLAFDPAQSYGTFDHPVVFTKNDLIEQPLRLSSGWNWFSLAVEPSTPKVSAVLSELTSWEARLKDHGSAVAYCNGTYWAGSMKEMHANTMYKMLLSRLGESKELPQPLYVVGQQTKLAEMPVTLHEDWNWIAYTPMNTMTLGEALAGANPKVGDEVKSQTAFAYYGPYGWEGNLEALESGKGYLYKSTDPTTKTFVYPSVAKARRRAAGNAGAAGTSEATGTTGASGTTGTTGSDGLSVFTPCSPSDYPDNMTMVVQLIAQGTPVADAEIAAFIGGECRGAAVADGDGATPLYYLLIVGEGSGQDMELQAAIGGSVFTIADNLTFVSDGNIGTPWEPLVIDIGQVTAISETTAGQRTAADTPWFTPQGILMGNERPTTPGIYLHGGKKVVIK